MTAVAEHEYAGATAQRVFDDPAVGEHYRQLHAAVFNTYNLQDVPRYLTEKSYLNGDRFSFKGHEFQLDIAMDTSREVNVQKCAQVGLSELMARYALAVTRIMPYFSVILTMPMAKDAQKFCKTRIDPIINDSPDLKMAIDRDLDNSEIKAIGTGLLYMRGTQGTTAALSVPADMLIHDELDRSDPATIGQYQSRLKHSRWKLTRKFGTPTADKVGISLAMDTSLRKRQMACCTSCNHWFVPSYHDHVVIPGFDGDKSTISKYMLGNLDWQNAYLACPRCGVNAYEALLPKNRNWVIENTDDNFTAIGYFVTPFSVPTIVSVPSLVVESTKYGSWTEFRNQALGETSADNEQALTEKDLLDTQFSGSLDSDTTHCMGIDVGQICHVKVGRIDPTTGMLLVVHRERCTLAELQRRKVALQRQYRVVMTVIDSFPETFMVQQMQKADRNLFGGVYHSNSALAVYQIVHVDEAKKEGKLPIHQAKIHRDLNFDKVMALFKNRMVRWAKQDDETSALFISHALDMTRKQEFNQWHEMQYVWQKSVEGNDHFWHALGYLHVACRLAPTAKATGVTNLSLASTIKMPSMKEVLRYGR